MASRHPCRCIISRALLPINSELTGQSKSIGNQRPLHDKKDIPGDNYTVVRNPMYYRAAKRLPYLDSVVFRIVTNQDTILKNLQAGTVDSAWFLDVSKTPRLSAFKQLHTHVQLQYGKR